VVAGLIAAQVGPGFTFGDPLARTMAVDAGFRFMLLAMVALVGALALARFLPDTPVLRHAVQVPAFAGTGFGEAVPEAAVSVAVGDRGRAITDLRPVGKVSIAGGRVPDIEARAAGDALERGVEIVVVEAGAGRVVVERASTGGVS
jgi:hypothetical protein